MAKKLVILAILLSLAVLPQLAWADVDVDASIEKVVDYVKTRQCQAGVFYEFKDQETMAIGGATLINDVLIESLDLSLNTDFDKALLLGADYSFGKKEGLRPFVQLGAGLDRIENEKEWGQFKIGGAIGLKYEFK